MEEEMAAESREAVAFELFKAIVFTEEVKILGITPGGRQTTRDWILDTYAECLEAASGKRELVETVVE
jgi:hypothetical protein